MFSKRFSGTADGPPELMTLPGNARETGLVLPDRNEVYLIDSKGDIHTGFPLAGSSPFTLFTGEPGSGYFNLLVGGKDGYLYNYAIK
jgi:hypothetical protein